MNFPNKLLFKYYGYANVFLNAKYNKHFSYRNDDYKI